MGSRIRGVGESGGAGQGGGVKRECKRTFRSSNPPLTITMPVNCFKTDTIGVYGWPRPFVKAFHTICPRPQRIQIASLDITLTAGFHLIGGSTCIVVAIVGSSSPQALPNTQVRVKATGSTVIGGPAAGRIGTRTFITTYGVLMSFRYVLLRFPKCLPQLLPHPIDATKFADSAVL